MMTEVVSHHMKRAPGQGLALNILKSRAIV